LKTKTTPHAGLGDEIYGQMYIVLGEDGWRIDCSINKYLAIKVRGLLWAVGFLTIFVLKHTDE